jgi:Fe-S cluster assembly ATP-binding protein
VDRDFTRRYLNEGFSGGEKKRCEILQMAILKPLVAVMDETDSGLDIDALRTVAEFRKDLTAAMEELKVPREMTSRYLNEGFSGGEKKRVEILQMAMLDPTLALLDETDSGLDIDALRIVSGGINGLRGKDRAMILVTHYQRILDYIKPDFVHVFVDGRIVESGGPELAHRLEADGYDAFLPQAVGGAS